ncbi:MAG: SufS family cysteine desulfurase [Atopobiaceae bacterium]|jgi:cysteine desulfurase/selenocysteine lyase|nr:SufS family cysteine desulfurase [Atopobiaceae bacterium]MCH4179774.1 SufS family cysteine desulfurase [Atopobiaceae bacterium]MCH4213526.1 SufS family cysteine desulfurase [Atopobiaceae bacterium]MCH4229664.1 SufS family cysteine desulfurase [Atopobiaceae bacterium]MCH4276174.1 SufS family cysteine desulfurase [Atopobiaceae bacterium]
MSRPTDASDISTNPYRADFPLLAGHPGLTYLDTAATAQRPAVVLDAQRRFYETMNANPLRGLYPLSVAATEAIDDVRGHVARFLGAADPSEVVFTRNTSESLNLVASSLGGSVLQSGDEVVVSIMEHHSNLVPWQQVCAATGAHLVFLRPDAQGRITEGEIAEKIGPHARVVSVAHVSNVLGCELPVPAIARRAHAMGATVVLDAAQSAAHMPLDVVALGADLVALSAHKLGGPMGVGVLWGRRELLEAMPPFLTGGEMIDSVTEGGAVWAPVPQKFEAGTQDAAGIYATGVALDYLEGIGWQTIEAREATLVAALMEGLASLTDAAGNRIVELVGSPDPTAHHGVVSFNLRGIHPHDVAGILGDARDVAIRAGHHCAQPLLAWLGLGTCCRASVGIYNDRRDVDALVDGLAYVWEVFHGND